MSREATIAAGRRFAEDGMVDTIRFERATGRTAINEDTGRQEETHEVLFTTPGKIRLGGLGSLVPASQERFEGGREMTTLRSVVSIPVNAPQLAANDYAVVEAIGSYSDPQLLGRRFRVVTPIGSTFSTARRFQVEEVVS